MKTARLLLLLSLAALPLAAQQPRITGGTVRTAAASSDLGAQIRAADGWVGYVVPGPATTSVFCSSWEGFSVTHHNDLHPAGAPPAVFFRVDGGEVSKIRLYSTDCTLDAEGRPITWLEGVDARASIAFVRSLIDRGEMGHSAVAALAVHSSSTDALLDLAKHHASTKVRGQALFWLSQQAGEKAAGALRDAVDNDPDTKVKEKAVFGISQLPNDQSIPLLADLARTHRNPSVRKKAIFWLGQKNDARALAVIEELLMR